MTGVLPGEVTQFGPPSSPFLEHPGTPPGPLLRAGGRHAREKPAKAARQTRSREVTRVLHPTVISLLVLPTD